MSEVRLSSVIGPAFHLLARDVFQHGHTHYDLSRGAWLTEIILCVIAAPIDFDK